MALISGTEPERLDVTGKDIVKRCSKTWAAILGGSQRCTQPAGHRGVCSWSEAAEEGIALGVACAATSGHAPDTTRDGFEHGAGI